LGNPVRVCLSAGQRHDLTRAERLIDGLQAEHVIADKGYDSGAFVATIERQGGQAVIPPLSNRKTQREYDRHLYKEGNLVERFINRIKRFRRVASRYDKTARNYLAFVHVACILDLLR
jgi:transposase